MDSRTRKLLAQVAAHDGWEVLVSKHIKVYKDGKLVVVTGGSPGDRRAYMNLRADLRRAGLTDLR